MRDTHARGGGSRYLYEPFVDDTDREVKAYHAALRKLGTPDQVEAKLALLDMLIEERNRRNWVFRSIKTVAGWATVVAAGWLGFKGLIVEVFSGLP